ncbi:MAG: hypothetical protein AAGG81_08315, partial [Chlamydiota bacterium]
TTTLFPNNIGQPIYNQTPQPKSVKLALNTLEKAQVEKAQSALKQAQRNAMRKGNLINRADEVIKNCQINAPNSDTLMEITQRDFFIAMKEVSGAKIELLQAELELAKAEEKIACQSLNDTPLDEQYSRVCVYNEKRSARMQKENELANMTRRGL